MNALRLLFGILTVLPVRPPVSVDRSAIGWAMTLAPLAGALIALVAAVPLELFGTGHDTSPLLAAVLCVAAVVVGTRAIHLDGLADVADGLGSGRRGEEGLEVMRRSDIGPFGVLTLVLVLLLQVAALAACIAGGYGPAALVAALVWSRVVVSALSVRFPAARPDGLGHLVAGTVSWPQLALSAGIALCITVPVLLLGLGGSDRVDPGLAGMVAFPLALLSGVALAIHAVRRFGGLTGDVYGAAVETTFTAMILAASTL